MLLVRTKAERADDDAVIMSLGHYVIKDSGLSFSP